MTELPAHVCARIAEDVSRKLGVDVSAEEVWKVLARDASAPIGPRIRARIEEEAREYGIGS